MHAEHCNPPTSNATGML